MPGNRRIGRPKPTLYDFRTLENRHKMIVMIGVTKATNAPLFRLVATPVAVCLEPLRNLNK